jgi:hypothetical protein
MLDFVYEKFDVVHKPKNRARELGKQVLVVRRNDLSPAGQYR